MVAFLYGCSVGQKGDFEWIDSGPDGSFPQSDE
jgi:hypothetical protein